MIARGVLLLTAALLAACSAPREEQSPTTQAASDSAPATQADSTPLNPSDPYVTGEAWLGKYNVTKELAGQVNGTPVTHVPKDAKLKIAKSDTSGNFRMEYVSGHAWPDPWFEEGAPEFQFVDGASGYCRGTDAVCPEPRAFREKDQRSLLTTGCKRFVLVAPPFPPASPPNARIGIHGDGKAHSVVIFPLDPNYTDQKMKKLCLAAPHKDGSPDHDGTAHIDP
jgi:hypothetical protein